MEQQRRPGMDVVEIGVSDPERSLAFYRDVLGFPTVAAPAPSRPGTTWVWAGSVHVALVPADAAAGPDLRGWEGDDLQRGMRHLGFKVGDVRAYAEHLRTAGVTFTLEPLRAVGDVDLAFFTDPDGTLLEIIDGHLTYHETFSGELAAQEAAAAAARRPDAGPALDHLAITVADLDATLAFYRDKLGYELIGSLDHSYDERGFLIHYLQAGPSILEVFTFTRAQTRPSPWTAPDPGRLGLRGVAHGVDDLDVALTRLRVAGASPVPQDPAAAPALDVPHAHLFDPDGVPLQVWSVGDEVGR
ncbi:MAG: VOC family protein [Kineosporiaceae bacterium]